MDISLIVAITKNYVIGLNNQMPWHLPADLAWFKQQTLHKPVVMGRKTFQSIGRLLPNRTNIILSKNSFVQDGAIVLPNLEQALDYLKHENEVMIIGGSSIFEQALPLAKTIYLTEIQAELAGDRYFPKLDDSWQIISEQLRPADTNNQYDLKFKILQRKI